MLSAVCIFHYMIVLKNVIKKDLCTFSLHFHLRFKVLLSIVCLGLVILVNLVLLPKDYYIILASIPNQTGLELFWTSDILTFFAQRV